MCMLYTHVLEVKKDKFDQKAKTRIFLGNGSNTKGYRIYSLKNEKIIVCKDVKFDEFTNKNWKTHEVEEINNQDGQFLPQDLDAIVIVEGLSIIIVLDE